MRAHLIALAVVLLFARVAAGQQRKPELKTTRMSDKLWLLEGAGGNVAVFAWTGGRRPALGVRRSAFRGRRPPSVARRPGAVFVNAAVGCASARSGRHAAVMIVPLSI